MMPTRLRSVTKVKNFLYVLNQRVNRIHLLTFLLGFVDPPLPAGGAGFFSLIGSEDSVGGSCLTPSGVARTVLESDKTGTPDMGVIPSWMGDMGEWMDDTDVSM